MEIDDDLAYQKLLDGLELRKEIEDLTNLYSQLKDEDEDIQRLDKQGQYY